MKVTTQLRSLAFNQAESPRDVEHFSCTIFSIQNPLTPWLQALADLLSYCVNETHTRCSHVYYFLCDTLYFKLNSFAVYRKSLWPAAVRPCWSVRADSSASVIVYEYVSKAWSCTAFPLADLFGTARLISSWKLLWADLKFSRSARLVNRSLASVKSRNTSDGLKCNRLAVISDTSDFKHSLWHWAA